MKRAAVFRIATAVCGMTAIGAAHAQPKSLKDQLIGTWVLVSDHNTNAQGVTSVPWGTHPLGTYMFDSAGHFAEIIINPDQDGATVDYYGTYSVDEENKAIDVHITGSSAKRFNDTESKRTIASMSDDEFTTTNSNTSVGGTAEVTWKRLR